MTVRAAWNRKDAGQPHVVHASNRWQTNAGEHVRNWARDFDAKQAG